MARMHANMACGEGTIVQVRASPTPCRIVSMALTTLPHRTFGLCGTIINEREKRGWKKPGLMHNSVSTQNPIH